MQFAKRFMFFSIALSLTDAQPCQAGLLESLKSGLVEITSPVMRRVGMLPPVKSVDCSEALLLQLNQRYLELHIAKEDAFWAQYMAQQEYQGPPLSEAETSLNAFRNDTLYMELLRRSISHLEPSNGILNAFHRFTGNRFRKREETLSVGLRGWLNYFQVNAIENKEALKVLEDLVKAEEQLNQKKQELIFGYYRPSSEVYEWNSTAQTVDGVPVDSEEIKKITLSQVREILSTHPKESVRKSAWEAFERYGNFAVDNGIIEIIKLRNKLATLLGFKNYYDYKVRTTENMDFEEIFAVFDKFMEQTESACKASVESVTNDEVSDVKEPWNFSYATRGEITKELDPYFPFHLTLRRTNEFFSQMGVDMRGGTIRLDLLDRSDKYSNGFIRAPRPAFVHPVTGEFSPSTSQFATNAVLGQVGSGESATNTFLHENGHYADFANAAMPSPVFSQEEAPTSIAKAELQSMFFDSFTSNAAWLTHYARTETGERMPADLIKKKLLMAHRFEARSFRSMLMLPYLEKRLYEMSEEELTPDNIKKEAIAIERKHLFTNRSGRPVLSIPHFHSSESAGYYHAYTMAEMGVHQTHAYLSGQLGNLVNNPQVGALLAEHYWRPGNSISFDEALKSLTGEGFSADAAIARISRTPEQIESQIDRDIEFALTLSSGGSLTLNTQLVIINRDDIIATTLDGDSVESVTAQFENWIQEQASGSE